MFLANVKWRSGFRKYAEAERVINKVYMRGDSLQSQSARIGTVVRPGKLCSIRLNYKVQLPYDVIKFLW